jgi:hypothetical protein
MDAGYEYDFGRDELSRFTWTTGASFWWEPDFRSRHAPRALSIDAGFSGSLYPTAIQWTPDTFTGSFADGTTYVASAPRALTEIETNYATFIAGGKFIVHGGLVLSAALAIPITTGGFQPNILGTLALEYYWDKLEVSS